MNPVKMIVTRFSGTSVFAKLPLHWTDKVTICSRGKEREYTPHSEIWENTIQQSIHG
jgi:hypothetical protein